MRMKKYMLGAGIIASLLVLLTILGIAICAITMNLTAEEPQELNTRSLDIFYLK